ncbi:MAG: RidA family protein [Pirellulales bacterium]|nr:RidA family protein [Pirellulales bacterium]
MSTETNLNAKLAKLGLQLPPAPEPKGLYKSVLICGELAYTSGHLPLDGAGKLIVGRLGAELDAEAGFKAAQWAGLNILASMKAELGSLDRIKRVVKILGLVNCAAEFTAQPAVVNGCSELFAEVFGPEAGVGARSAVGVASLPLGAPVEIEAVFELQ